MKIGIDARLYGTKYGGIGRYLSELIANLQNLDKKNEYVIFCNKDNAYNIKLPKTWKKVIVNVRHYTLKEQMLLPSIFAKENLDLLHIPHFNVPLLYRRPFVVTIHDITWYKIFGTSATTLPAPVYLIKHLGYRLVLKNALENSKKIIVPSKFVKDEIVKYFKVPKDKVVVIYEGVTKVKKRHKNYKKHLKKCLLYVGNLYPHKNVEKVILALKKLLITYNLETFLIIACSRNFFYKKFKKFLTQERMERFVRFIGYVSDRKLFGLYKDAQAFIFPSLSEGFGLPGLEAMASGTPVLASDIPVFREVYSDAVLYFNPEDVDDIANKIMQILTDKNLRAALVLKGKSHIRKYSWRKMAKETKDIYESCLSL